MFQNRPGPKLFIFFWCETKHEQKYATPDQNKIKMFYRKEK